MNSQQGNPQLQLYRLYHRPEAPISPDEVPEPKESSALVMIEFVNEWIGPEAGLDFLMEDREQFAQSQEAGREILEAARREGLSVSCAARIYLG